MLSSLCMIELTGYNSLLQVFADNKAINILVLLSPTGTFLNVLLIPSGLCLIPKALFIGLSHQ